MTMRRLLLIALALIAVAAVVSGCMLPPPAGPAPLRYRDEVFPNLTETDGLAYGSAPDAQGNPQTLTLDMYRPTGDTQTLRPAIVLIHGGGFVAGDSKNSAMVQMAQAFARRGYVAVSINYRLLGDGNCAKEDPPSGQCVQAAFAAQHDAQAAIRWLRKNAKTYGVDPFRIAVGGGSAGAVTALAVAVRSDDPGDSGNPGYSSRAGAAVSISGVIPSNLGKLFYDPHDTPTIMFHGTKDPSAPYLEGLQTATDMHNAGIPVIFEALPNGGHVPVGKFGDQIFSQSAYFAYAVLDLAHAAGQPAAAAQAAARQAAELKTRFPAAAQALRDRPAIPDR
jgi:acetyl esterase/lipase